MNDTLVAFAVLAWLAYLASRLLARHHLPELVAFLIVGALLGPSGPPFMQLIDEPSLIALRPVTEVALAVLMFVIGERVSVRALRAARWTLTTGIAQYVLSAVAVFWVTSRLGADRPVALVLGALAGAGAPMTIAHIVTSVRARGSYPTGIVGTHAVSDALATTTFAAVLPIALLLSDEAADIGGALVNFVQLGIGGTVLGLMLGWFVSRLGFQIETSGELLLFVLVHIVIAWTIAGFVEISLPLAALVAGATAATVSPQSFSVRLFRTIKTIEQPLYLLFFALAGASIHLSDVPKVGLVGVAYIVVRVAAKIMGGLAGGLTGGLGWRRSFWLGVNLTPQAGVAVGLAVLASERLSDVGSDAGVEAATVVLGAVVLFELIGPLLVARDLRSWSSEEGSDAAAHEEFELPARVLVAAPVPVDLPEWLIDQTARWRSSLVVLMPGERDEPHAAKIGERCGSRDVDFEFRSLRSESFTAAVVRSRGQHQADLVVLFAPRPPGGASRLVLLPSERIARQLPVPVLTFPLSPTESDQLPRPRRLPWQSPGRGE
ncbi:cation:proton antiporter [Candidatus Poriferisodalis sp.]|uniref:cation:proton antiporter n=1 Tax=Candidatus Poriferisodalis sp. TaxID=3101277 RepID=UPI003B02BC85